MRRFWRVDQGKPKAFYKYVRNKRMNRVGVGPVKDSNGKLCVVSEEIGEALNEYFSSVFTQEKDRVVEEIAEIQAIRIEGIEVRR